MKKFLTNLVATEVKLKLTGFLLDALLEVIIDDGSTYQDSDLFDNVCEKDNVEYWIVSEFLATQLWLVGESVFKPEGDDGFHVWIRTDGNDTSDVSCSKGLIDVYYRLQGSYSDPVLARENELEQVITRLNQESATEIYGVEKSRKHAKRGMIFVKDKSTNEDLDYNFSFLILKRWFVIDSDVCLESQNDLYEHLKRSVKEFRQSNDVNAEC